MNFNFIAITMGINFICFIRLKVVNIIIVIKIINNRVANWFVEEAGIIQKEHFITIVMLQLEQKYH